MEPLIVLPAITRYIVAVFALFPLFIAIYNYKYLRSYNRFLFLVFVVSALADSVNFSLMSRGINNMLVIRLYTIFEFVFFNLYYLYYFKRRITNIILFKALIVLFVPIAIYDFYINGRYHIDYIASFYEGVVIAAYALFFFYYIIKLPVHENLINIPEFWINAGILVYFAVTLLFFLFSNYLFLFDTSKYDLLWATLHRFCRVLYTILMSIGIWKLRSRHIEQKAK